MTAETLRRVVDWRNPFKPASVPLVGSLHRLAYSPSPRLRQELPKIALRPLLGWAYKAGLGGRGSFTLSVKGEKRTLSYDGRNLQFSALYMPQNENGYETEVAALLDLLVVGNSVFYDVGSNWGYHALMLAARAGYEGKVHAFEPGQASFRDLESLVRQAGLEGQIRCHRLGLSDRSGQSHLVVPDAMHSGTARVAAKGGESVILAKLDDLGLTPPDAIKLDVEDHELEALSGAKNILSRARPMLVFESALSRLGEAADAPLALLEERGYRFFHPAWEGGKEPRDGEKGTLLLVPFERAQRPLLRDLLNVLACHGARLPELKGRLR